MDRLIRRVSSLLLLALPALAAEVTVPRLEGAPKLEDFLTMQPVGEVATHMAKVPGEFVQREPSDGAPASQKTDVYLSYDRKNLYLVFVAFDTDAKSVRARLDRRDSGFSDDAVEVMLDTFHDQRRAYVFAVNPFGVQFDALWTEGRIGNAPADFAGFDQTFDTLWHSDGKLTPQGYVTMISLPFKSLRFSKDPQQTWGIILNRTLVRTQENLFWPQLTTRIQGRMNQAATMDGLHDISPGRNIQIIPYGAFRSFHAIDLRDPSTPVFANRMFKPDVGVDAKVVLHDSFVLDTTVNPDFSQVESDEPQVTVNQRFEVFFPEKRPFFLENANFFQTPLNLVFTRRIGHPEFGARLTGRTGPWALGLLASDDRAPGEAVPATDPNAKDRAFFVIGRVNRDIFSQSTIGAIFTDREFAGQYNRVGGVDANFRLSPHWRVSGQAVESMTRDSSGAEFRDPAFSASMSRSGRQFNANATYTDIYPNFVARSGFIPRSDLRQVSEGVSYLWRPEGKHLIAWGPRLTALQSVDHDGTLLQAFTSPRVEFQFRGNTSFSFTPIADDHIQLRPSDYSVLTKTRAYPQPFWGFNFDTQYFKSLEFHAFLVSGGGVNYNPVAGVAPVRTHEDTGRFTMTFRSTKRLRVDNTYLLEHLRDNKTDQTFVTNHILRTKWNWQFTRELAVRTIVQYSSLLSNPAISTLRPTKNVNFDFLVSYLLNPGTAVYVGYNSNLQNLQRGLVPTSNGLALTRDDFMNDGRQFFVKVSYLLRF